MRPFCSGTCSRCSGLPTGQRTTVQESACSGRLSASEPFECEAEDPRQRFYFKLRQGGIERGSVRGGGGGKRGEEQPGIALVFDL